jgi:hypothetical protein
MAHSLGDFLRALSFGGAAARDTLWRGYTTARVGRSVMRQAAHRYGFLINYRSEGSRRLLSDVPAKVPAKFRKMNSFCYNPGYHYIIWILEY